MRSSEAQLYLRMGVMFGFGAIVAAADLTIRAEHQHAITRASAFVRICLRHVFDLIHEFGHPRYFDIVIEPNGAVD